jgi:alpha-galactosidase
MARLILSICIFIAFTEAASAQKFKGLAERPPMGWNSWNTFAGNINEDLIQKTANAMVKSGMRDAGYVYVVLDDCWSTRARDSQGNLVADPAKFPSGMKALGDYLHERGLKFGIYNCAGSQTCAGYPGGAGHEEQDATLYASWGVDYLKYDWCNTGDADPRQRYGAIRDALYKAKRPVVLSMCEWGKSKPWLWARDYAHLWRTTGDITDQWAGQPENVFLSSVKSILDRQVGLERYAGPDGWNDPDMLEVGNPGLTVEESRAHFSMWCMLAAPLMAGNDVRNMKPEIEAILTNADAIAIDQDAAGKQGYRERATAGVETWIKQLAGGEWAVCLLNSSDASAEAIVDWKSLRGLPLVEAPAGYQIYDVWNKRNRGTTTRPLKQSIASHDVALFRLAPIER